ncbi:hypothetical protein RJ641_007147 [Dillenia turbinata]|uniref:Uncharacterized protein n=1 Tax=Dillenia turbinata TaxID=194707 RepID=A0AAN8VES5_9MAGN
MESANRKRRGFVKGKLMMPFYRSAKPSAAVPYTSSTKVKPSQSSPTTASVGYIVDQDFVIPRPKQKVSFILPENYGCESDYHNDNPYGVVGDESVDMKAASYISCVQERFKLERSISERKKYSEAH